MFFPEHKILCAFNSGHLVLFIFLFVLLKLTLKKKKKALPHLQAAAKKQQESFKKTDTPSHFGSLLTRGAFMADAETMRLGSGPPSFHFLLSCFFQEMGLKTSCISPSPALSFRQHLDSPESILSAGISQWKPVYPAVLRLPPTPSFPRLGHPYELGVPKKTDVAENYKIQSAERTQRAAAFPARSRGNGPGRGGLESTEGARGSQGHRVDSCALSPQ